MAITKKNNSSAYFIKGILNGEIDVLSKAITVIESANPAHRKLAANILKGLNNIKTNSFRLGITGVPGVGKSTFIESFGKKLIEKNHKLAVLAIDPSSTKSKGSILGDKTRMEELSKSKNVFIRPSPNGKSLGGVARSTYETILLCEAAGFDFIIIETVGVGQSEIAVSRMTDFFLLLMLAGAGDELQGIKRGIMEMADSLVITKADGNNKEKAKIARGEYARAMHLLPAPESGFTARVEVCSALENQGMDKIYDLIQSYKTHVSANQYFQHKRKTQNNELLKIAAEEYLISAFNNDKSVQKKIKELSAKKFLPFVEAVKLVDRFIK
ncbi:MAG: methylmalonyl Co-A mutase-associated GTPase MeaB [Sphingobacteriaceae bacterium]|nr:methylmalonyl Co-A mutase-associated GTPase MeaB [Sphingobacteriaceae bacterium]